MGNLYLSLSFSGNLKLVSQKAYSLKIFKTRFFHKSLKPDMHVALTRHLD